MYAKKEGVDEKSNVRFKARLIAKGYEEGIDYNESFSPVVNLNSYYVSSCCTI